MEPVVIIQARMSSTRLPGKVLLPLGTRPVLGHVVDRCRSASPRVVVATSTGTEDDVIERWCESEEVACVRGSRDDVLRRFLDVFDLLPAVAGIRVTSDCPLVDPDVIRAVWEAVTSGGADYASVASPWPLGLPSEGFRVAALREADRLTAGGAPENAPFREHVTLYLYRHPERFRIRRLEIPHGFAEPLPRLTLDEPDDYDLLKQIGPRFPYGAEPNRQDLVDLFRLNPGLRQVNAHVAQRPV